MASIVNKDISDWSKYVDGAGPVITNATEGSAKRNREFIGQCLKEVFQNAQISVRSVFEIGTGTGHQVIHFAEIFPEVTWYTSDRTHLEEISTTLSMNPRSNIQLPVKFDIEESPSIPIPEAGCYDAIYASNVVHCIPEDALRMLIKKVSDALTDRGLFIVYGPYDKDRTHTSPGNKSFHEKLQAQDPRLGLRDISDMQSLSEEYSLSLRGEYLHKEANNYVLVFQKKPKGA